VQGHDEPLIAKLQGDVAVHKGDTVHLSAPADVLHLFDKDGKSLSSARRMAA